MALPWRPCRAVARGPWPCRGACRGSSTDRGPSTGRASWPRGDRGSGRDRGPSPSRGAASSRGRGWCARPSPGWCVPAWWRASSPSGLLLRAFGACFWACFGACFGALRRLLRCGLRRASAPPAPWPDAGPCPVTAEVTRTGADAGHGRRGLHGRRPDDGRSRGGRGLTLSAEVQVEPDRDRDGRVGGVALGHVDDVDEALGAERVAEEQAAGEGQHDAGEQGPTVLGVQCFSRDAARQAETDGFHSPGFVNHFPRVRDANGPNGPCRLTRRPTLRRTSSSSPRPRAGSASG